MKMKLFLILVSSLILTGCFNKGPTKKEVLLQQEVEELKKALYTAAREKPEIIENPTIEELSAAEIAERNAIHNEIQTVNKQVLKIEKEKELAKAKKLEEEKQAAIKQLEENKRLAEEAERQIQKPVVPPTSPVIETPPVKSSGVVKVNTKQSPLTLRSNTNTNSKALDAIPKGTKIEYGETKQVDGYTWYNVKYDGKEGWLRSDYLKQLN